MHDDDEICASSNNVLWKGARFGILVIATSISVIGAIVMLNNERLMAEQMWPFRCAFFGLVVFFTNFIGWFAGEVMLKTAKPHARLLVHVVLAIYVLGLSVFIGYRFGLGIGLIALAMIAISMFAGFKASKDKSED